MHGGDLSIWAVPVEGTALLNREIVTVLLLYLFIYSSDTYVQWMRRIGSIMYTDAPLFT